MPVNFGFFVLLVMFTLEKFSESQIYWVQIFSFIHLVFTLVTWLGLDFIPYLILTVFGDTGIDWSDTLSVSTFFIKLFMGPLNAAASVLVYFYTVYLGA